MKSIFLASLALGTASTAFASFAPISFTTNHDWGGLFINGATFPTGSQTLGGVPFELPSSDNIIWHSHVEATSNPRTLTVPVNLFGVSNVHTLINSFWGEKDPGTFATVEFHGSDGAYSVFNLDGDVDIRDYNNNAVFTTQINGTTTVEVFNNGQGQYLDKQLFALPATFADEHLVQIVFRDNGAEDFQRIFVAGITAEVAAVPEGGMTRALAGLAIAGLAAYRRKLA